MSFAAMFPGKCSACGEWFPEGAQIRRVDGKSYAHNDCEADETVTPTVAREVCPRCWLERSVTGECGCDHG